MSVKRKLATVYTPSAHQGFLGAGHTARALIQRDYSESDPFILLMDDVLDKQNEEPAGGPHLHAGFETVSLVLEVLQGSVKIGEDEKSLTQDQVGWLNRTDDETMSELEVKAGDSAKSR